MRSPSESVPSTSSVSESPCPTDKCSIQQVVGQFELRTHPARMPASAQTAGWRESWARAQRIFFDTLLQLGECRVREAGVKYRGPVEQQGRMKR